MVSVFETILCLFQVRRRPPSKKAILTRLQSEVQAFKQTFLRAVDIVEQMGHTMDSLELMENSMWNESNLWQNETRSRRHAIYPLKEEMEPPLVRKLADQMRTLPLEKVRQIRSGKHVFGFLRNIFVPQSFYFLWAQVLNYLIVIKVTIFSCRRT